MDEQNQNSGSVSNLILFKVNLECKTIHTKHLAFSRLLTGE